MANVFSNFSYPKFKSFLPVSSGGTANVGGLLYSYLSGTSFGTPQSLFTDPLCTVPATNPVVLDANGEATIYGNGFYDFKLFDINSNLIWTFSDIELAIVNPIQTFSEWLVQTGPFTYVSSTSFSVSGNQTAVYTVNRRLKSTNTGGTIYSTIVSSSFATGITTVTVINDSGVLDSGLVAVSAGLEDPTNISLLGLPFIKRVFSVTNNGSLVTLGNGSSTAVVTFNAGTVNSGDIVIIQGGAVYTSGNTTAAIDFTQMVQTGTAGLSNLGGSTQGNYRPSANVATYTAISQIWGISSAGTLIANLEIQTQGTGGSVASNSATLVVFIIRGS